jgi:hypothetical protein
MKKELTKRERKVPDSMSWNRNTGYDLRPEGLMFFGTPEVLLSANAKCYLFRSIIIISFKNRNLMHNGKLDLRSPLTTM